MPASCSVHEAGFVFGPHEKRGTLGLEGVPLSRRATAGSRRVASFGDGFQPEKSLADTTAGLVGAQKFRSFESFLSFVLSWPHGWQGGLSCCLDSVMVLELGCPLFECSN